MIPNTSACLIDTSHYNTFDDDAAHDLIEVGLKGIALKVTQGTSGVDPTFIPRKARFMSVNLGLIGYHFLTDEDGTAQANHFLANCGLQIAVAIDCEQAGVPKSVAQAFAKQIEARTGLSGLVYGSPGFLNPWSIDETSILSTWHLWEAEYGVNVPRPVQGYGSWSIWQNTDHRAINGVIGNVDGDVFHRPADAFLPWLTPLLISKIS